MSPLNSTARQRPPRRGMRFDIDHGALFDASALAYDLFRPGYPDAVISEMAALSRIGPGSRLLEVGCGTGQATVALARREFRIDCVDPGQRLVALARGKCSRWPHVRFIASRFEEAAVESHAYDIVVSAQAFHWVSPALRLHKAARVLKRQGSLALLYNYPAPTDDPVMERLSRLIQRESGGWLAPWDYRKDVRRWAHEISASGLFQDVSVCRHSWEQQYSADEYVGLFRTYSDFLSLPVQLQERVAQCIQRFITKYGGSICRPYHSLLIHARKAAAGPRAKGQGMTG